jgi:membrane fusion protein, multidrug efflux system
MSHLLFDLTSVQPKSHSVVLPRISRGAKLLITSALIFLPTACKKEAPVETKVEAPAPAVKVQTVEASAVSVPRVLELTGTLRGSVETDLAANVSGQVIATNAERGQKVARGAILARVDVRAAALSLAQIGVQLESSKTQEQINTTDCQRYEKLKARGIVTDLEYDQATAKCKTAPLNVLEAKARQDIAAKTVGDGVIRAPFAGTVSERFVDVGEYVQASSKIVTLSQVSDLKLEFSVPEQNYAQIKVGAPVNFQVAAYGARVFSGKVSRISGAIRATRDVLIEAKVDNPEQLLVPGMFTKLQVEIGSEELPSIPQEALLNVNGKMSVFVVNNGLAEQRILQVAPSVGARIPVRRGLSLGEKVVGTAVDQLKNGQSVL